MTGLSAVQGLFAGSITFAGGHGSSITWSSYFTEHGYPGTEEFGLISATLGLILGGLVGGPVSQFIIKKNNLTPSLATFNKRKTNKDSSTINQGHEGKDKIGIFPSELIKVIFLIAVTIFIGQLINNELRHLDIVVPNFLVVLIIGALFANIGELFGFFYRQSLQRCNS